MPEKSNWKAQDFGFVVRMNVKLWNNTHIKIETDRYLDLHDAVDNARDVLSKLALNVDYANSCANIALHLAENKDYGRYVRYGDLTLTNIAVFKVERNAKKR